MNKSIITNGLALLILIAGIVLDQRLILSVGLFALAGAITNWLAVHMLFEKVPFLYGSGVIPARFEDFKKAIKRLMMEQFFTEENFDKFLGGNKDSITDMHLAPVIEKVDLNPAFESLVKIILESSLGKMLGMFGGESALESMRDPFIDNMKHSLINMTYSENFQNLLREELEQPDVMDNIRSNVEEIIEQRLNELTPELVKQIVQDMIKQHLGWLVVWGGVFGGIIGLVAALIEHYKFLG